MEAVNLRKVVIETLDSLTNQIVTEELNISHRSISRMKKGSPINVDFFKTINFIELVLKNNGLIITNKVN